jgi:hypothetical protein
MVDLARSRGRGERGISHRNRCRGQHVIREDRPPLFTAYYDHQSTSTEDDQGTCTNGQDFDTDQSTRDDYHEGDLDHNIVKVVRELAS